MGGFYSRIPRKSIVFLQKSGKKSELFAKNPDGGPKSLVVAKIETTTTEEKGGRGVKAGLDKSAAGCRMERKNMMKISTKGRYALRIMLDLAQHDGEGPVALRTVVERQNITLKYTEGIMAMLVKAKLVVSLRGKMGGYRLAKRPHEYTVYEVLLAAEGDLQPVACGAPGADVCPVQDTCPTRTVWVGLGEVIRNYLQGITLRDLVSHGAELSYCSGI